MGGSKMDTYLGRYHLSEHLPTYPWTRPDPTFSKAIHLICMAPTKFGVVHQNSSCFGSRIYSGITIYSIGQALYLKKPRTYLLMTDLPR